MNEPVYAWSDALNRRVCIGVNVFDSRAELLPDRAQATPDYLRTPNGKAGRAKAKAVNALPSQQEVGDRHAAAWYQRQRAKCACGRLVARGRRTCDLCLDQRRRLGRKVDAA